MHSQILFPSLIPAAHPLAQPTHPPPQWSRRAPPPFPQPCAARHMPPHPWWTVGCPPQSMGQYQGMCAFMAGWVHEPAQSLDHTYPVHVITIAQSQTQGIEHTNTCLSSKENHNFFCEDCEKTEIICAHEQFPSLAQLADGGIRCARWE